MTNQIVRHVFVICRHCNQICLEIGKIKSKLHSRLSVSHFSIVNNNKCTSVISKLYNMNRAYLHVIVINLQYITTSRGHLKEEVREGDFILFHKSVLRSL